MSEIGIDLKSDYVSDANLTKKYEKWQVDYQVYNFISVHGSSYKGSISMILLKHIIYKQCIINASKFWYAFVW
jgi:hypothetical protein